MLGENAEAPREFFCIEIREDERAIANIGILSIGVGIKPSWLLYDGKLFIGFNDCIAVFTLKSFTFQREICLMSLFYEFISLQQCAHLCVVCETAVVAVLLDGSIIWRKDTDLITNYKIEDNIMKLDFMDTPSFELNLLSGKQQAIKVENPPGETGNPCQKEKGEGDSGLAPKRDRGVRRGDSNKQ
jgi:hypothetical protein